MEMERMEKGGALDRAALMQVVRDIEYIRRHGCYPWCGASGRRAMEERYTYDIALWIDGKTIDIDIKTSATCSYVRYSVAVKIDGAAQRQYLKALKALIA